MRNQLRLLAGRMTLAALLAVTTSRGVALQSASPTDTASDDVAVLMKSVGERVRDYYDRVTSVICTETVLQEELRADLSPLRRLQETVYDLMIVRQPSLAGHVQGEVVVERRLKSIDGRPVRAEDRPHWADPRPISEEPLAFILPENQRNYRFSPAAPASSVGLADPLVVDFAQLEADPLDVTWVGEYFIAAGGRLEGRLWVEQQTHDVLQMESRLREPIDIPVPFRMGPSRPLKAERLDAMTRFAVVKFQDPDETLLLPQSIERTIVVRGSGVPRLRTIERFSDFGRFRSEVRVQGVR